MRVTIDLTKIILQAQTSLELTLQILDHSQSALANPVRMFPHVGKFHTVHIIEHLKRKWGNKYDKL